MAMVSEWIKYTVCGVMMELVSDDRLCRSREINQTFCGDVGLRKKKKKRLICLKCYF